MKSKTSISRPGSRFIHALLARVCGAELCEYRSLASKRAEIGFIGVSRLYLCHFISTYVGSYSKMWKAFRNDPRRNRLCGRSCPEVLQVSSGSLRRLNSGAATCPGGTCLALALRRNQWKLSMSFRSFRPWTAVTSSSSAKIVSGAQAHHGSLRTVQRLGKCQRPKRRPDTVQRQILLTFELLIEYISIYIM